MSDDEADAAGAAAADAYAAEFAADDDYDESIFAKKAPEPPSEAVLKSKAREIIAESDRDKVTYRMVRNMLEGMLSLPASGGTSFRWQPGQLQTWRPARSGR